MTIVLYQMRAVWSSIGKLECPEPPKNCTYHTGADVIKYLAFNPDHK